LCYKDGEIGETNNTPKKEDKYNILVDELEGTHLTAEVIHTYYHNIEVNVHKILYESVE